MTPIYPLTLTIVSRTSDQKITLETAQGGTLLQGQELLSRLKGKIDLVSYQRQRQQSLCIEADQVFSLNPTYAIWDDRGRSIGMIQRGAWWNAQYQIYQGQRLAFQTVVEDAGRLWIAIVCMGLFVAGCLLVSQIIGRCLIGLGFIGLLAVNTGYLCNATYWLQRPDGRRVMQFAKVPSLGSHRSQFTIRAIERLNESEELPALLGIILMLLRHSEKTAD
jgi:hypothetical protein